MASSSTTTAFSTCKGSYMLFLDKSMVSNQIIGSPITLGYSSVHCSVLWKSNTARSTTPCSFRDSACEVYETRLKEDPGPICHSRQHSVSTQSVCFLLLTTVVATHTLHYNNIAYDENCKSHFPSATTTPLNHSLNSHCYSHKNHPRQPQQLRHGDEAWSFSFAVQRVIISRRWNLFSLIRSLRTLSFLIFMNSIVGVWFSQSPSTEQLRSWVHLDSESEGNSK